jgi:hypothetical protein
MNRLFWLSMLVLLLSACAGPGPREEGPGEVYLRHAGMTVDQVRYSSVRGWQPVGDEAVLVDFGVRGHYLFELSPNCHFEVRSAPSLRFETSLRGVVNNFDHVFVGSERCNIVRIRQVDYAAARAELREEAG